MPRRVDFSDYIPQKDIHPLKKVLPKVNNYLQIVEVSEDEYTVTLNILVHNNPNKTIFTIEEVALQMNMKEGFIRSRIKQGKINVKYFGDKPMIHISELARLLTQGLE